MPVFMNIARWATAEAGRYASAGLDLLGTAVSGNRDCREAVAALTAKVRAQEERITRMEGELAAQATGLAAARAQVDSLIGQLNGQLLPGIDERIHETERDLTKLATRLVRADQDAARRESRLTAAERRVGDLRERTGRLEQRTGLWRELQANVARLGEDLDALRARLAHHPATQILPSTDSTPKDLHR